MRLDIRYQMRFDYDAPVREAHNEIRVRPRDLPGQRLLAYRLTTFPQTRVLSFTDYWGTNVDHFGVVPDHQVHSVVAESAVETRHVDQPTTAPVADLRDHDFSLAHIEYLRPSAHVEWDDDVAALAHEAVSGATDVIAAVRGVVAHTRAILHYEKASTQIGVTLGELISGGAGVCQDFTHLAIGLLRAAGVPARYVSGYLFAADETVGDDGGEGSEAVQVQTHAWVEAAIPGRGWLAVDPTNDRPVGERHVVIGFGRDYDDVAPVRGIYLGDATPEVEATVEIRRMEPMSRTMSDRPRRRASHYSAPLATPDPAEATEQQQQQQQQQSL